VEYGDKIQGAHCIKNNAWSLEITKVERKGTHMPKTKGRTCYTCRLKGHLSQDCPNGNKSETKLVNSKISMHGKTKNGNGTSKVISSPYDSIKIIWVPKSLLTNLEGPNKTWIPKLA
jgi:hypothetical protein